MQTNRNGPMWNPDGTRRPTQILVEKIEKRKLKLICTSIHTFRFVGKKEKMFTAGTGDKQ